MKPSDPLKDFEKLYKTLLEELLPRLKEPYDGDHGILELDRTEETKARELTRITYTICLYKMEKPDA